MDKETNVKVYSPGEVNKTSVLTLMAKARAMTGNAISESAAIQDIQDANSTWSRNGAIVPPYDPESLLNYIEMTPHLRPCIDAITSNVDGNGYHAVVKASWMDNLDSDEATNAIREALEIEAMVDIEQEALASEQEEGVSLEQYESVEVSDEQIEAIKRKLKLELRREQYLFDSFFKNCCSNMSYDDLRIAVRDDYESFGWGCIELKRDSYGRLKRLDYVPGHTVRPIAYHGDLVRVTEDDSVTPISEGREVVVERRFRTYVQIVADKKIYYKSPGDPRVVSRTTGEIYETLEDLRRPAEAQTKPGEGPDAIPANELLWLSQHYAKGPCPPPRWIGNLLSVLGVREADETNYFYLSSNAIPAGMLLISGGTMPKQMHKRLEKRMQNELSGPQGSGKILVLEATPSSGGPNERTMLPTITWQSLREAQNSDALFTNYDVRSCDRIGASFRLPPMLRGYTPSNLNRATAFVSLSFAEEQVFSQLRDSFDWKITKYILSDLGIKHYRFKSNSPPTSSTDEISEMVSKVAPHGGLTPNEIRDILGDILNKQLPKIEEEWGKIPMVLTLSGQAGAMSEEQPEYGSVNARLQQVETIMSQVVTEQMREAGLDYDWKVRIVEEGAKNGTNG